MKTGISTRIFLLLAALSIVAIGAMGVAARVSFNSGFLGYLNNQGFERLDSVSPAFAAAYQQHGSWDFLRNNPRAWLDLLGGTLRWSDRLPDNTRFAQLPESDFTGLDLRLALLDADRHVVMGHQGLAPGAPMKPIVAGGATVGWLALVPFQQATAEADVRFQKQDLGSIWIVGLCMVCLAAVAAWWLARLLVTPLLRITDATHRLSGGDYDVRIPVLGQDELGRLSHDFNQLAQALAQHERLRRSFMADMSHELRTPLAVLKGELEAIEDGVRASTPATLASLRSEVDTLTKLVDDLFDLSLSDVGALRYRMAEVDVGELLEVALTAFSVRFSERGLKVEQRIASPLPILADEGRLQQLFNNLLENCARYIDQGGTLRIRCNVIDSNAVIELEDSGPGVPPDIIPHLFERFFRVESSRTRAQGGAGLGLAICRNIVAAHGGSITATQGQLGGLLVRVRLPRTGSIEHSP